MSDFMTVVPERISLIGEPARYAYHLAKEPDDADWQPVHCGGGIALPWRTKAKRDEVCRACLKAAKR